MRPAYRALIEVSREVAMRASKKASAMGDYVLHSSPRLSRKKNMQSINIYGMQLRKELRKEVPNDPRLMKRPRWSGRNA